MTFVASVARFPDTSDPDALVAALRADGAVLVDEFIPPATVAAIRAEVDEHVAAAEAGMRTVNPAVQAFFGPYTKHVSALAAVSPTFADAVIAHPTYAAICDAILLPSCSRYQLNLGHLIARGPGAEAQFAAPRRRRVAALPAPARRAPDRVAGRAHRLPRRHRRHARRARQQPLGAWPAPAARRRRRRGGPTRRRGDLPRLHHPLRRHQLHRRRVAPRRARQLHPRLVAHGGEQLAGGPARDRAHVVARARRSCSATRCTTPSPTAAATWAWSACATRWSCSPKARSTAERTRARGPEQVSNPVRVASGAQGQLIQPVTVPLSSNDPPGVD